MDKGTDSKITNGSTKLSNWAAKTKKMNNSASTNTSANEPDDSTNSREVPLRSVE